MAKYWCRYFDRANHVVSAERLIAIDDAAAIANARKDARIGAVRFELWRNVNFVHEASLFPAPKGDRPRPNPDLMVAAAVGGIARLLSCR